MKLSEVKQFNINDVHRSLKKFITELETSGSGKINIEKFNLNKLAIAIADEYDSGAKGSVYDIICDLSDTVGLGEFRI